jgi:O-antigen ligase
VSNQRLIVIRYLSFATLSVSLIALPFSIAFCHVALIAFLLVWIAEGGWTEKISTIKQSFILKLVLAFIALQLIGILYTEDLSNGWFSLEKKIFLFLVPIAIATSAVKFNEKEIRLLFYSFTAACLAGVLVCVVNAIGQVNLYHNGSVSLQDVAYFGSSSHQIIDSRHTLWLFFSYIGLAKGINIHPTYFSVYLAFSIFFVLYELMTGKNLTPVQKVALSFIIALFSLFIVCLSSRIVIISLISIYAILAAQSVFQRSLLRAACVIVLLAMVSVLLYLNPVSRYRNIEEIGSSAFTIKEKSVYSTSAEIRASLWWLAWKSYTKSNLLFGTGTGNVTNVMKQTSKQYEITNVMDTYDPHNQYLFLLISHGIVGLIIFALWLLLPFVQAWSRHDYLYMAFSFLFAALCLTESALELQKGIVFFALIQPLLAFQRQSFQTDKVALNFSRAGS